MQSSMIYSKLKSFFPNDIENINFPQNNLNFIDQSNILSFIISSNLPHLSIDQIHSLCSKQQKNVMQKIIQIKKFDIYEQIGAVCPTQKNLKNMPIEEVSMRINQFSAKMAIEQSMKSQSDDQHIHYSDQCSQNSSEFDQQRECHPMKVYQENFQQYQGGLRIDNIFEEHYNAHLPWNQMCIYDLN